MPYPSKGRAGVQRNPEKRAGESNNPGGRKGRKRGRREKKGKRERGRGMQNQWAVYPGVSMPSAL